MHRFHPPISCLKSAACFPSHSFVRSFVAVVVVIMSFNCFWCNTSILSSIQQLSGHPFVFLLLLLSLHEYAATTAMTSNKQNVSRYSPHRTMAPSFAVSIAGEFISPPFVICFVFYYFLPCNFMSLNYKHNSCHFLSCILSVYLLRPFIAYFCCIIIHHRLLMLSLLPSTTATTTTIRDITDYNNVFLYHSLFYLLLVVLLSSQIILPLSSICIFMRKCIFMLHHFH